MPLFTQFLASVDDQLHVFKDQLYLRPGGAEALGKALFIKPEVPYTAGWDSSPLGAQAIRSLAGIKNATDEMSLASQQSQAIARNSKIAALRTFEAMKSYEEIFAREAAAAEAKAASGPKGGALSDEPSVDVDGGHYLREDLKLAFANVKQVSLDAAEASESIIKQYQEVRSASGAISQALNLPGYQPPPPIAPIMLKPPKRPRDLSPFWLDLPYGINPGADPYASHTGAARDSAAETVFSFPGFNPMEGTVPVGEDGLSAFYKEIKPGGKLKPGLDLPAAKGLADGVSFM